MSRTKIAGYLMVAVAVLKTAVDILDGNGFDFVSNLDAISAALAGAGLVFLRDAVAKVK
jgi:hypothetical protein